MYILSLDFREIASLLAGLFTTESCKYIHVHKLYTSLFYNSIMLKKRIKSLWHFCFSRFPLMRKNKASYRPIELFQFANLSTSLNLMFN